MVVHELTSNPCARLLSELSEDPEPLSLERILEFARQEVVLRMTRGWHADLDAMRDYLGDYLRDAGVAYPLMGAMAPERRRCE